MSPNAVSLDAGLARECFSKFCRSKCGDATEQQTKRILQEERRGCVESKNCGKDTVDGF